MHTLHGTFTIETPHMDHQSNSNNLSNIFLIFLLEFEVSRIFFSINTQSYQYQPIC